MSSYLDLLDAQRSLFTAQLATVQVRAAQLQNLVALYRVLGGGWSPGDAGGPRADAVSAAASRPAAAATGR